MSFSDQKLKHFLGRVFPRPYPFSTPYLKMKLVIFATNRETAGCAHANECQTHVKVSASNRNVFSVLLKLVSCMFAELSTDDVPMIPHSGTMNRGIVSSMTWPCAWYDSIT